MIKTNCLICGKEINNPRVEQLLCGSKECRKEYIKGWRSTPKGRAWIKEYNKRPKVKEKIEKIRKINQEATKQLKERHREEFESLKKMIKKRLEKEKC